MNAFYVNHTKRIEPNLFIDCNIDMSQCVVHLSVIVYFRIQIVAVIYTDL